ncbi:NAD(P)-dependent dehydrogenase, short-chain alcohol dehydrogenase family [Nitrosomonas sp. Nm51]|uniref:SDR family NAD(P)-dependent oxidoreductase n=1 Tax=Nitrosomonas sp. Nm51 TaxID=133720 RepID=UPI0008B4CA8F|nr:SDR family NAD(P)-dependent oxidoreductase [Nitrosomonas sp. Nm51]SER12277.1 NAD(P)-dependent dehydrogenase, short-chain alcohol dehydrogenase family [Nitrosomonas sp. Nm51]
MTNWNRIGAFQIDQKTSCQFAQASGDYNPLHVDPVLARRYQFGTTVMHGVCGVLKALDCLFKNFDNAQSINSIRVQFVRPVLHGECVDVFSQQSAGQDLKLRLLVQGRRVQDIDLKLMRQSDIKPEMIDYQPVSTGKPQPENLQFENTDDLEGTLDLVWMPDVIQELFPYIKKYLPDNQTAVLLGLTQIVGMRCPGLHSVFTGLAIRFEQKAAAGNAKMQFKVLHRDNRFSLVTISITHNTASGEITALFRPEPVSQERYAELQGTVTKNRFADQKALIIGGSRGIGEVTAKLIAAGGGHSVITYYQGEQDAQKIARDIRSHGGRCDVLSYNVLSESETGITNRISKERFSHIYYFASPLIEKGEGLVWDDTVFQKFCHYYLKGFAALIEKFLSDAVYRKHSMTVFVPSTVFLEQPQKGFAEYIAAKAAVEAFVRQLSAKYPGWTFHVPRLPRMLTDQTSGLNVKWTQTTAATMLDILMSMSATPN